jgi:chemotaxis protein CheZ
MSIPQAVAPGAASVPYAQPIPPQVQVAIRLDRIFDELAELRQVIEQLSLSSSDPSPGKHDDLWVGIAAIHEAIVKTRQEIASLHAKGVKNEQIFRATDELDAVVVNTESATDTILSAAESIDAETNALIRGLAGEQRTSAERIHDETIRIFEACNFQDLTGQRIRKVVDLLQFIETRIASMIAIWRSVGEFREDEAEVAVELSDADLLNGPPLAGDAGIVSQDDIDSLFR